MEKITIYKEKITSTDPRLGRHVNHDSRSLNFPFNTTGLSVVNKKHERYIPILNQGDIGACTGFAGVGSISTSPFINKDNLIYNRDHSGSMKLYSEATVIDPFLGTYPPVDTGSNGLSIAKVLKGAGLISNYKHTFTLFDALKAGGVYSFITGTRWYSDMFNPDADGRCRITGNISGGHQYQLAEIDIDKGIIWFYNSWGEQWGSQQGKFYLTWADYATLLAQQGDVIVLIPPVVLVVEPVAPIKPIVPVSNTYKYFSQAEVNKYKLKIELWLKLDIARGYSDTPYRLTSGLRTPSQNALAGGTSKSSHLTGEGVDISCIDSGSRFKIILGLIRAGFTRIGIYPKHIHADISTTLPQGVIWFNEKD